MPPRPPILLALVLAALLLPTAAAEASPGACPASHAVVRAARVRDARDATLCLLNRMRASHGLPRLRLDRKLSRAANRHSRDMVRHRYFSHDSRDGASAFDRMRRARYVGRDGSWVLGENIGWGSGTLGAPASLMRMWMHSAGHRANILDRRFRDIGIGIAPGSPAGRGGATYTTDFGHHW